MPLDLGVYFAFGQAKIEVLRVRMAYKARPISGSIP